MIQEEIKKIIKESLDKLGISDESILVESPKEKNHGDYSSSVALVLAKNLQKNPLALANEIASKISSEVKDSNLFERVEVAPPGFINFYLSDEFFIENIKKVLKDKNFGKNNNLKNQKIIIEYTDPNPFKEFHIGHLMSNSIGESISRIIEFHGAKVKRANYQGDVGIHVAKAIFGKMKNPEKEWQAAYVFGSEKYESDEFSKKEIVELNRKIFERSDSKINKLYDKGKKWSLSNFEKVYKKLGTKFDYLFFESQTAPFGKSIVEEGLKKGVFEKGEKGAIVFKGEKHGLHTRVFVNSEGLSTYEAKELGLANVKYGRYKYDKSIIVTGKEINEYFKVLLAAMGEIFPDLSEKTFHVGHGMMRLPSGKMSSRTGQIITAEWLIDEVKQKIRKKIGERSISDYDLEKIVIGAIKYSILKQSIGSDIIYDFEKSISFEGSSGPYLQYSLVRANSVLEKAKEVNIKSDPNLRIHPNDPNNLEKMLIHFPEVIEKAGKEYEPHLITTYLTELAREFNNYYAKEKIVDKEDKFSPHKIALTQAFSIVMKNGLWLLGIPAPNKM